MSLEELMKEPKDSPLWRRQRTKLMRVLLGLGISAAALIVGAILLFSFREPAAPKVSAPESQIETNRDAASLAELMKIQKEAEWLRSHRTVASTERLAPISPRPNPRVQQQVLGLSYDPGEGFTKLNRAQSEVYIPTGAVFQAELLTPIKTSVERTFVMAEITNDYRMDMKRKFERGSRLIGRSHFDPILKGVIVEFNMIVSPKGIESSLSGLAMSRNALPQIEGLYFSDKLVNYGTALAFGFLSGFSSAGREREVTAFGSQPTISTGNQVLEGLSVASFQVANQILNDIRERSIEYVVVPAGEPIFVVLTQRYNIDQATNTGVQ